MAATTVEPAPPPPNPSASSSESAVAAEPSQETTTIIGSPDTIQLSEPAPAPDVVATPVYADTPATNAETVAAAPEGAASAAGSSFVLFNERSTALDAAAEDALRQFAKSVADKRGTIRILTWAGAANVEDGASLAEKRAIAVAEGLIALGVDSQRVSALVMKGPEPGDQGLAPPSGRASITLQN
jgi:outer membrane protein OmpA-like peptidoglycan-associated protein